MEVVQPEKTIPGLNPPLPQRPAELLFQLGTVQCFWFPEEKDVTPNQMPHHVYWRDMRYSHTFGPFPSMFNAMAHCTYLAEGQKSGFVDMTQADLEVVKPLCPTIIVDFKTKQRVQFNIPGGEDASKKV